VSAANGDSRHWDVRPFVERAREWQKANPEWQLICDIGDTETLYQQWSELPKRERMSWVGKYGESARSAFEEFGTKRCKVESAVLNADMQLCEVWPMGEAMRAYRTNASGEALT